ncbi:DNA replication/repair protein RecF [Chryseobacterium sp. Ch-15]|uniref:DNA replication and repair protein RecF n=1 Tax=Chryseobacterium muglaense TaxID=2893752 RepID=A0A9Q3YT95_9FLAO|nr:DNA replication/repair protein RecF [Chryseobacterium muglaense]MBD3905369.1 DNA replication/repair protein RecF [Chryseobacterium muglaense]MCC9036906.1 DNA replication/repair protein RecF [Chryseobacterium muglaense]MCM2555232.1 DNA replication/repair protein RecF [Chryseobacterium muglaense]
MIINKLTLYNFKNHSEKKFEFSPQINCFVGNNGVGKTNILDALHYLSVGKSFLGNTDTNNIKKDEDFFTLDAEIQNEESEDTLKISQPREAKKVIKKNDKSYDRMADHIGYLPSVMISPYDSNLISDSGESRRKFLDSMISQTDSGYLYDLIQYQKTIQQRNALLKYFAKNRVWDKDSLEIYDDPITKSGTKIFEKRREFVAKLNPIVQNFYQIISGGKESVSVIYESHLLNDSFENLLKESLERDRMLTYTSKGIHKDDLLFEMDSILIKKIGSQGQQKSFLISLKLAQMSLIKELTNKTPILLLDDIFDKLDDTRVAQLIKLVNQESFGQIFITDTHRERTESVVKKINEESIIFEV